MRRPARQPLKSEVHACTTWSRGYIGADPGRRVVTQQQRGCPCGMYVHREDRSNGGTCWATASACRCEGGRTCARATTCTSPRAKPHASVSCPPFDSHIASAMTMASARACAVACISTDKLISELDPSAQMNDCTSIAAGDRVMSVWVRGHLESHVASNCGPGSRIANARKGSSRQRHTWIRLCNHTYMRAVLLHVQDCRKHASSWQRCVNACNRSNTTL